MSLHVMILNGAVSTPAWKTKPSWYLVVTEDKMIPPPAQQFMARRAGSTVREVGGSHAIYVSKPQALRTSSKKPQPEVQRPKRKRPNKSWLSLSWRNDHFAAREQPELSTADLRAGVKSLRTAPSRTESELPTETLKRGDRH